MTRPPIRERMEFGVKAIDSMLTIGKGTAHWHFAGSGVGKSTLMGMIAKNVKADINVIALVGERAAGAGIHGKGSGAGGMRRSILVVATSDQPAMLCASSAPPWPPESRSSSGTRGYDVLLMMDSLTRFAMAQRGDWPGGG